MAEQRPWEPTDEEVQALLKRSRKASKGYGGQASQHWAEEALEVLEVRTQRQAS